MRSLFAKILAWFVVAILITLAATVITTALTYDAYSSRQAPFSMLLSLELSEARQAWESGGSVALANALERSRKVTYASQVILTDGNGTDLLTGESDRAIMRAALGWIHFPFTGPAASPCTRVGRLSAAMDALPQTPQLEVV